ncbi:MAG TPA: hypothetical protein PK475_10085 [Rectinema sp.]|nr:hypothetical protein [Rectinema sp.]
MDFHAREKSIMSTKPWINANVKRFIIEKSIEGFTSSEIMDQVQKEFNLSLSYEAVRSYRLKYRDKIKASIDKLLESAYATQPLAMPEKRLEMYWRNIQLERMKVDENGNYNGDGRVINEALRNAAEDLAKLERLRLKMQEYELKKGLQNTNSFDEIIATIERRTMLAKKRSDSDDRLIANSGWRIEEDQKKQGE